MLIPSTTTRGIISCKKHSKNARIYLHGCNVCRFCRSKNRSLYRKHLSALKRQGKAPSTIDVYARAVRRVCDYFDAPADTLSQEQLEGYFESLVGTHSWSTVKVDRNGLQFFYKHILKRDWEWVDIVKPPQSKHLPDVLTLKEIERLINGTRERRYQTFILVTFSMGLRLGEALNTRVSDIDSERMTLHVRQGKGKKGSFLLLQKLHTPHPCG